MPWWADILDVVGLLAVLAVAVFLFLFVRRRVLSREGGTFECSVRMRASVEVVSRRAPAAGSSASAGTTARSWSGSGCSRSRLGPKAVFDRSLEVLARRKPHGAEAFSLYAGHIVVGVSG